VASQQLQKVIERENFRIRIPFPTEQVLAESALSRAELEPIVGGRPVQPFNSIERRLISQFQQTGSRLPES
jgi:hypothetical protein